MHQIYTFEEENQKEAIFSFIVIVAFTFFSLILNSDCNFPFVPILQSLLPTSLSCRSISLSTEKISDLPGLKISMAYYDTTILGIIPSYQKWIRTGKTSLRKSSPQAEKRVRYNPTSTLRISTKPHAVQSKRTCKGLVQSPLGPLILRVPMSSSQLILCLWCPCPL